MRLAEAHYRWTHGTKSPKEWEQFGDALYRYVKAIVASQHGSRFQLMEDAIGETVCKVLKALPEGGIDNITTFVYALTCNTCVDIIRQRQIRPEEVLLENLAYAEDEHREERISLEKMATQLHEEEVEMLLLKLDGRSNEDIATIQGTTVSAIKSRWFRLEEKLRTLSGGQL